MLCETVMIVPFLKASASPKIKPTWNGPEITSRFHVKSKGGWGGVFDAPAAPNRGVEDSAPATPGLLLFREVISGLFPGDRSALCLGFFDEGAEGLELGPVGAFDPFEEDGLAGRDDNPGVFQAP